MNSNEGFVEQFPAQNSEICMDNEVVNLYLKL